MRRRPLERALVVAGLAAIASACAGSDSASTEPDRETAQPDAAGAETRAGIGPRALDLDRAMLMVVDSIDASGDDIRVRIRVANLSEQPLDVGNDDTIYGPLLTLADDLGNTYPALGVEPAGVYGHSIGRFDLRLDGPLDHDATELTAELSTQRGALTTDPFRSLEASTAQWWSETPAIRVSGVSATNASGRTVGVLDIVDRGTHLEISFRADDASSAFSGPDDHRATLTLADGTALESLPPVPGETQMANAMGGVLRFPGTLPVESEPLVLTVAGVEVEIPVSAWPTTPAPPHAGLAQLPDLIHAKITNDPLPTSTFEPASTG